MTTQLIDPYTNEPLTDPPADLMRLILNTRAGLSDALRGRMPAADWDATMAAGLEHIEAVARVVLGLEQT